MKVVLIRHGQPDYSEITERGFIGHGRDLAPLTENGIYQAEQVSLDPRLSDADFIVSSPYTRALQTAAVISKNLNLPIRVEVGLHEWLPDLTFQYSHPMQVGMAAEEYEKHGGVWSEDCKLSWESVTDIQNRAIQALEQYRNYEKIIVVTHGMVMRQLRYQEDIAYCEILEWKC